MRGWRIREQLAPTKPRPGNVRSAEGLEEVLLLEIGRQQMLD